MKMRTLIAALLTSVCRLASATAQIPEIIELNGKPHALLSEPFTFYLAEHKAEIAKLERLAQDQCTGSWRGYQGNWVIANRELQLKSLFANPCKTLPDPIPLTTFFPDATGPVHAKWFTGKLVVPLGKRTNYVHMGYMSEYERYLIISVKQGHIISKRVSRHKPTLP